MEKIKMQRINVVKFLVGMGSGMIIGLLFAPQEGSETRRQLARVATEPGEVAREQVANVRQKAGNIGANLGRWATEKVVDKVVPESLSGGTSPRT
jgi:gas vesicle protein